MQEITDTIKIGDDFSYEIRFYCDLCGEEVGEYDQLTHREGCNIS